MKNLLKRIWNKKMAGQKIGKAGIFVQIDSPVRDESSPNPYILFSGFCVTETPGLNIENISIILAGTPYRPHQIERKDVSVVFPKAHVTAFQRLIPVGKKNQAENSAVIEFHLPAGVHRETVHFSLNQEKIEHFRSDKAKKLSLIKSLLLDVYPGNENHFNALAKEELDAFEETGNISAHDYDSHALEIINSAKNKMILDAGAGLRKTYYPNVVNLEIVDYPTTDVLGTADALPFKDGVFDAVLSLNVLEHVRNPEKAAGELLRVLKPGGTLYVAVPFLQPFHGYPNHYYNMTINGLKNLFETQSEIVQSGVLDAGEPIYALQWILGSYLNGLPEAERTKFSGMSVSDLLAISADSDLVKNLADDARTELACVNFILAVKHGA